jgi:hypothetical protein
MSSRRHETNGKHEVDAGGDELRDKVDKPVREMVAGLIRLGCDLRTASWAAGRSPVEVKRDLEANADFVREVKQAESTFEYKHLQHLEEAAKDKKNWRVSMWLLERRLPDKYEKQRPRTVKESQLMPLLKSLADAIVDGVEDDEQRAALLKRVEDTVEELDPNGPVRDDDGF